MTISFPTPPIAAKFTPKLLDFGSDLQPSLGGQRQWVARLGNRYGVQVDMPPLSASCFATWISAAKKSKASGVELLLAWPQPLGVPDLGSPVINGAGQAGMSISVHGMTASREILAGSPFSLVSNGRRYLHSVTDTAEASSGGSVVLTIEPMLRVSPADADVLDFATPSIQGFLDGSGMSWEDQYRRWQTFSFSMSESA